MAVEAGLADQDLDPPAEPRRDSPTRSRIFAISALGAFETARDTPVGARIFAEGPSAGHPPHSPVVTPAWAQAIEAP